MPVEDCFEVLAFFVEPFIFGSNGGGVGGGDGVLGDAGALFFDGVSFSLRVEMGLHSFGEPLLSFPNGTFQC